jgi:TolB-like protein/DNA-binding winged helix-turn-helix (wHTH) protein
VSESARPFRVGDWLVEPDAGRLCRGEQSVKLEPKVMALLVYLAQRPGQVVSREELEQTIWAGTVVGYDALSRAITKLRHAFEDDSHHPRLLETVAKKGYRLIAPVTAADSATPAQSPNVPHRHRLRFAARGTLALASLVLAWFAVTHFVWGPARALSIVVLPFANLSDDPKLVYFSDGISDDIITDLSRFSGLVVIARQSSFAYKDQPLGAKGIAEALGARYALEGSVRRAGDDIRISAKLIDTQTGRYLWTEAYNRKLRDIFAVQDDVTRNIVKALALTLTVDEKEGLARRYTRSTEAYDLFLRGQAHYARNLREQNLMARSHFQRALALDESFARAHVGLALTHTDDIRFGWTRDLVAATEAARRHAERAMALDARSPQAHFILGYVNLFLSKDRGAALKMAERAIVLDPNFADGHAFLAASNVYVGDLNAAVRHMERAMLLNPVHSSRYPMMLGAAHYFAGRYDQARAALEQSVEQNPLRLDALLYLAATLNRLGRLDDGPFLIGTIRQQHPEFRLDTWAQAQPFTDPARLNKIVGDLRRIGLT